MSTDYLAAAARWLTEQPYNHHQVADLARALGVRSTRDGYAQLEGIQDALERLDVAGLCVVYHGTAAAVAVQHRDALRRVAAGEPLPAVARDVEPRRPVTITRVPSGEFAAWYRSALRLPAGADAAGVGGALGATPDAAYAALRDSVTRRLQESPDPTPTGQ